MELLGASFDMLGAIVEGQKDQLLDLSSERVRGELSSGRGSERPFIKAAGKVGWSSRDR